MRRTAIAVLALALTTPAFAQTPPPATTTPAGTDLGTAPSSPENSGPGSDREVPRNGLGADTRSNNPGASGNAGRPELGTPNTGGGGGK